MPSLIQQSFKASIQPGLVKLASSLVMGFTLLVSVAQAGIQVETWHTQKGTKVMYVAAPQLPMLDIDVTFDAGSARDGDKPGVAYMTTLLLGTQTKTLSEQALADKTDALGINLGGDVQRDTASFSLRTLTRSSILTPALALFSDTLTESVMSEEVFLREKARVLVGLKQKQVSPENLANEAFWAQLYANHPYAHPVQGTVDSVKNITLNDLNAFYKRYMVAQNATISIVGNVTKAQAQTIAEQLFAKGAIGQKPEPLAAPIKSKQAVQKNIEFDSSQTYFRYGQLGVERGHPDYYALFLGNHLLGGSGFGSLLMAEVREKRGLVYGISSGFAPMRYAGPWSVALSTKNQSAKEAQTVVENTLKGFMQDFDAQQFEAIKDNLVGGFPLRIDSNGKIIGYISMMGFYNLPLDYLEAFPNAMARLTKQDVLAAWQRQIDLNAMTTVMVGKPQ
ncbi:M16 family metallopeptidase [Thiomicrorhabdus aquaedulcis]|uniref:M16 family metallopeptidase n=1 Tax=Thiomicrorhabdus aquaedulcis TaxID=2211106 RepID=UPI001E4F1AB1|nr:pitrilysin family protein [Thiomicrorhabdus aquaedulcis]